MESTKGLDMGEIETDFLTVKQDFLTGAGTIFNLGGNSYLFNLAESGQEADERALRNDFAMVGQDLRNAMSKLLPEKTKHNDAADA
jgi:hypothetical protein